VNLVDPAAAIPDLPELIAEATRLLSEAEERVAAGEILPAISSLGALPRLNKILLDVCAKMLVKEPVSVSKESEMSYGNYL